MTTAADPGEPAPVPPVTRIRSASRGLLSEGPRWDADRAELLRVDIMAGEVHTAPVGEDGHLGPVRTITAGRHAAAAAPAAAELYVLALAGGFLHAEGGGLPRRARRGCARPAAAGPKRPAPGSFGDGHAQTPPQPGHHRGRILAGRSGDS